MAVDYQDTPHPFTLLPDIAASLPVVCISLVRLATLLGGVGIPMRLVFIRSTLLVIIGKLRKPIIVFTFRRLHQQADRTKHRAYSGASRTYSAN